MATLLPSISGALISPDVGLKEGQVPFAWIAAAGHTHGTKDTLCQFRAKGMPGNLLDDEFKDAEVGIAILILRPFQKGQT